MAERQPGAPNASARPTGLARWAVDVSPLRTSPAFRTLYAARTLAFVAYGLNGIAVAWQVYDLMRSSLQVALVAAFLAIGHIAGLVFGGRLADRHDRRRLMVGSRIAYVAVVALLLANALRPQPALGLIFTAALISGLSGGLGAPALLAAQPTLVRRDQLASAGALTAITMQLTALIAPAIAGLLIAGVGLAACYASALSIAALSTLMLSRLPPLVPTPTNAPPPGALTSTLGAWLEGLRFVRGRPVMLGMLLLDLVAGALAMPYVLLPQIATETLGGGPAMVGLLHAAPALGALLAALTSGWTRTLYRPGRILLAMAVLWGLWVAAAGTASQLWGVATCLALAGAADTVGEIVRGAWLQQQTPDALRGRVSALWLLQSTLGPALGGLQAGYLSRGLGATTTLLVGGAACLFGSLMVGWRLPALWRAPPERSASDSVTATPDTD